MDHLNETTPHRIVPATTGRPSSKHIARIACLHAPVGIENVASLFQPLSALAPLPTDARICVAPQQTQGTSELRVIWKEPALRFEENSDPRTLQPSRLPVCLHQQLPCCQTSHLCRCLRQQKPVRVCTWSSRSRLYVSIVHTRQGSATNIGSLRKQCFSVSIVCGIRWRNRLFFPEERLEAATSS